MDKLQGYKKYFNMIDGRTPFSLFDKHVFNLIELAERQQIEIQELKSNNNLSREDLPSLKGRGTRTVGGYEKKGWFR